jgi:hypothetical protein
VRARVCVWVCVCVRVCVCVCECMCVRVRVRAFMRAGVRAGVRAALVLCGHVHALHVDDTRKRTHRTHTDIYSASPRATTAATAAFGRTVPVARCLPHVVWCVVCALRETGGTVLPRFCIPTSAVCPTSPRVFDRQRAAATAAACECLALRSRCRSMVENPACTLARSRAITHTHSHAHGNG